MRALLDRRVVAVIGAFLALALALAVGYLVAGRGRKAAGPAAGALTIEQGAADSRTASTKPLRCFVEGKFVGMATVAECAQKNGVASQALDVGLDPATGAPTTPTGSLAPAVQPPPTPPAADTAEAAGEGDRAPGPAAECLRYGADGWRPAGGVQPLGQCAKTLFEGRCARPGEAVYGRWGGQTLRIVSGRVEMASDNRSFHPLMSQDPEDCALSPE